MFEPGCRIGVAVSGGADSVCLLYVLRELAPRWALSLSVVHVNHRLRGADSDADEAFVRGLAAQLGFEFHCHADDVRSISESTGDNLEQAARRVRHEFYRKLRSGGVVDRIALGHTRSDQAETVLFRLLRGAGTAGMAAIRPLTRDGLVRPLLEVSRPDVRRFLELRGIPWREDASNQDLAFTRNRIRHVLLPVLARDFNPSLEEILAGMAEVAQDEERYWEGIIEELAGVGLVSRPPALLFRAEWLGSLPAAVARRVVRYAIERVKGDLRGVDFEHVERILALARSLEGSGRTQVPGLDVFRSFDWVRLAPPGLDRLEERNYSMQLAVPGRVEVPGTNWALELQLLAPMGDASSYNESDTELDWGRIAGGLELRNWRPGDQYRPVGHACETKIKSLFQAARVPLWDRRRWPVITSGDAIVWVAQFGPSAEWVATPRTRARLKVREIGDIAEFCSRSGERRRPIGESTPSARQAGEAYEF